MGTGDPVNPEGDRTLRLVLTVAACGGVLSAGLSWAMQAPGYRELFSSMGDAVPHVVDQAFSISPRAWILGVVAGCAVVLLKNLLLRGRARVVADGFIIAVSVGWLLVLVVVPYVCLMRTVDSISVSG